MRHHVWLKVWRELGVRVECGVSEGEATVNGKEMRKISGAADAGQRIDVWEKGVLF